jgi:RNA-directed DNA polymerase
LLRIIYRKIKNEKILRLIKKVVESYRIRQIERERESKIAPLKGMPIGNLTSQILANIYLNELDRFVKHMIKPQAYLRYGDDFIIITKNLNELKRIRNKAIEFINKKLQLEINAKNDIIIKVKWGLKFLGVWIYPGGRKLNKRNKKRIRTRLEHKNIPSYSGLVKKHGRKKFIKELN